jgi:hypothetical protein
MFINIKPFERDFSKIPLSEKEQNEIYSALKSSYNFIKEIQTFLPKEKYGEL